MNDDHYLQEIGKVTTFAGTPKKKGCLDGNSELALFNNPQGICFHPQQKSILFCDYANEKLRKVSLIDGMYLCIYSLFL